MAAGEEEKSKRKKEWARANYGNCCTAMGHDRGERGEERCRHTVCALCVQRW